MKTRLFPILAAAGSIALAACYPLEEPPQHGQKQPPGKPGEKTLTSQEQQKLQEEREKMKEKEKEKMAGDNGGQAGGTGGQTGSTGGQAGGTGGTTEKPPGDTTSKNEKKDYAYANKVPGKEGFVFSPYNNKIVDVRDIPSGTLVQDPTYTGEGKGYFRVP